MILLYYHVEKRETKKEYNEFHVLYTWVFLFLIKIYSNKEQNQYLIMENIW